ncbi:hypothetical protein M0802_000018 [Mischocyttarus mexicanus]|nr:hypothetical protein M0802_000018 [Mischocyttarus mexicanus]
MFINSSSFAKKQLQKYGWTEGKGLGRSENGITEALKPKLKFNNEGLGYSTYTSPRTEWWQTSFDKAAKNIVVNNQNDEISFSVSNENSTADRAATVMLKSKESREKLYNNFRRIEMLNFSGPVTCKEMKNTEKEEEEVSKEIPILTDDELLKACEGRTGHKGSRHGITMRGKLERIHQQEKRLLHLMKRLTLQNKTTTKTDTDFAAKLININNNNSNNNNNNTNETITAVDELPRKEDDFQIVKSRSAIRKEKRHMQNLAHLLNNACKINNAACNSIITENNKNSSHKHKKCKNRRNKTASISEIVTMPKEYLDLANSDQLPNNKMCKKYKKLFLVKKKIIHVKNTFEMNYHSMSPIITAPEEKHDLANSDQSQNNKMCKKHKKLFFVEKQSTSVGNTYQLMYCSKSSNIALNCQQISKHVEDTNNRRTKTVEDWSKSIRDDVKVPNVKRLLSKKMKRQLKLENSKEFHKYVIDTLYKNVTEDVSSKLQNLSVKGNNEDKTGK